MSNPRALPAPHDAIAVDVQWHGTAATVTYTGPTLEALHAAGCIDGFVLGVFTKTRQRMIRHHEIGWCQRKRAYRPLGWSVTWQCVRQENIAKLPGTDKREPAACGWPRVRWVGRSQRPVRWVNVENLIVPDWDSVRVRPASN